MVLFLLVLAGLLLAPKPETAGEFTLKGAGTQQVTVPHCFFSPDEKTLIAEGGGYLHRFDVATKQVTAGERGTLLAWPPAGLCWRDADGWVHRDRERLLRLLPNGEYAVMTVEGDMMAVTAGGTATGERNYHITRWNLAKGEKTGNWDVTGPLWESRAASRQMLAYCTKTGALKIWELRNKLETASAQVAEEPGSTQLAFTPDASLLVVAVTAKDSEGIGNVSTRNPRSGELVEQQPLPPRGSSTGLGVSPDGTMVAVGVGEKVLLWDIPAKKLHDLKLETRGPVEWLTFSPSGKMLAATSHPSKVSGDVRVTVWKI